MAGFANFEKIKVGEMFTIGGEHFIKDDRLFYHSVENAPLGQTMMDATTDAKVNVVVPDTPQKPMVDCSAKIVDSNNNLVKPPTARKLSASVESVVTPAQPSIEDDYTTGTGDSLPSATPKKLSKRAKAALKVAKADLKKLAAQEIKAEAKMEKAAASWTKLAAKVDKAAAKVERLSGK